MAEVACTTTFSAMPPQPSVASTESPTCRFSTPSPTALTVPAISPPGEKGSSGLNWYLSWMIRTSGKLTPQPATSTTTWPGPGVGSGTSSTTSDSGGPNCLQRTARMPGNLTPSENPVGRSRQV